VIDLASIPLSPARRAGDLLFLAGQVALDGDAITSPDIEGQTRQVMANIQAVLSDHGLDLSNVVNATVWLAADEDFGAFNRTYAEYFSDAPPARTTVISKLLLGAKIEIAVVAHFG